MLVTRLASACHCLTLGLPNSVHMTFACAMLISKASKEVCKACFRKYINISKEHVPRIGNFSIANTLLFFANRYVPTSIARSDIKRGFMAVQPCTLSSDVEVRGKMHGSGQPRVSNCNKIMHTPPQFHKGFLLLIFP